jgi:hypothetical protein
MDSPSSEGMRAEGIHSPLCRGNEFPRSGASPVPSCRTKRRKDEKATPPRSVNGFPASARTLRHWHISCAGGERFSRVREDATAQPSAREFIPSTYGERSTRRNSFPRRRGIPSTLSLFSFSPFLSLSLPLFLLFAPSRLCVRLSPLPHY